MIIKIEEIKKVLLLLMQIEHVNYPQQHEFYDYDIIKAHDGKIKVETKKGGGCVFIIKLPI